MCSIFGCRVLGDALFSCELNKSQRKSKILFLLWTLKTWAKEFFFFSPYNFPQGQALRLPPSLESAAYFKGKHRRWVKMTSGSPVFSRCHGHRSRFSLKSPLRRRNFDLKKKSLFWNKCLFLFFVLYSTHKRKPSIFFWWDGALQYLSFEYCSKYINHSLVWLNEKDNIF